MARLRRTTVETGGYILVLALVFKVLGGSLFSVVFVCTDTD
jgi:hypothetical protein